MDNEKKVESENEIKQPDLSYIEFAGLTLQEWEDELTVKIPSLPCNSFEITQVLINLSNKFQISYNNYNKLLVLCSKVERQFKNKKDELISKKISSLSESGIKRFPSKESIELLVLAESNILREMQDMFSVYKDARDFFENNTKKLEKILLICKDISYSVNASNKIEGKSGVSHGL